VKYILLTFPLRHKLSREEIKMAKTLKEKVKEYRQKNGYFNLTPEERVKANKECLKKLTSIPKNDYAGGKKYLAMLRGDIDDQ
jgi:hypothetical protein